MLHSSYTLGYTRLPCWTGDTAGWQPVPMIALNCDGLDIAGQEYYLEIKISRAGGAKLRLVDQKEGQAASQKSKYEDAKNIRDRRDVRPSGR